MESSHRNYSKRANLDKKVRLERHRDEEKNVFFFPWLGWHIRKFEKIIKGSKLRLFFCLLEWFIPNHTWIDFIHSLYTLSDTERCYSESIDEICQTYGKTFTWEVKVKQMGQKEAVSAQIAIGEYYCSVEKAMCNDSNSHLCKLNWI